MLRVFRHKRSILEPFCLRFRQLFDVLTHAASHEKGKTGARVTCQMGDLPMHWTMHTSPCKKCEPASRRNVQSDLQDSGGVRTCMFHFCRLTGENLHIYILCLQTKQDCRANLVSVLHFLFRQLALLFVSAYNTPILVLNE